MIDVVYRDYQFCRGNPLHKHHHSHCNGCCCALCMSCLSAQSDDSTPMLCSHVHLVDCCRSLLLCFDRHSIIFCAYVAGMQGTHIPNTKAALENVRKAFALIQSRDVGQSAPGPKRTDFAIQSGRIEIKGVRFAYVMHYCLFASCSLCKPCL